MFYSDGPSQTYIEMYVKVEKHFYCTSRTSPFHLFWEWNRTLIRRDTGQVAHPVGFFRVV